MLNSLKHKKAIIIFLLSVIILFVFQGAKDNQFSNWDDDYYVVNNQYIRALNWENLKALFTKDITMNNYHPLCLLSLAFNYYFAQLNPSSYYMTNVAIHVLNAIFVFILFFRLCSSLKMEEWGSLFVAGVGALWFGIHPMHVESVCWIAERKDVLYTTFYLAGLITYLNYVSNNEKKWFWWTFVLFVLSCLSKPMAVVFPASLLCIDVLLDRGLINFDKGLSLTQRIGKKLLAEKFVFFLASLVIGGAAFYTQNRTGAVAAFNVLTIQERLMFASYGFFMYIYKLFEPTYLSTFYPYPFKYTTGYYHQIFYFAPFIALTLLVAPVIWAWKKGKEYMKVVVFGVYFFFVNIVFVLQFISVGAAIMADRYSYVAYIGLFFLIPWLIYKLISGRVSLKIPLLTTVAVFSVFLMALCVDRTKVWHSAETLETDGVTKYPFKKDPDKRHDPFNSGIATLSYKWLGNYYFHAGDYKRAMECFDVCIKLRSTDQWMEAKINKIMSLNGGEALYPGVAQDDSQPVNGQQNSQLGTPQKPTGDFKTPLDSSYYFASKGDTLKAFRCYINAFRYNQGVEAIYADSAFKAVQAAHNREAMVQYTVLMKLRSDNPFFYFYRGCAVFGSGNLKGAVADWEQSLKIKTKQPVRDVIQSASYNLCVAYDSVGKDSLAVYYLDMAKGAGYNVNAEYEAKVRNKRAAALKRRQKK